MKSGARAALFVVQRPRMRAGVELYDHHGCERAGTSPLSGGWESVPEMEL